MTSKFSITVILKILFVIILSLSHSSVFAQSNVQCQTPNQVSGVCVPLTQCPSLVAILRRNPVTTETKNFLRQSQCGFQETEPMVCCSDNTQLVPLECGRYEINKIIGGEATEPGEFPWQALLEYTKPNGKGFYCGGVLISSRYVLTSAHCISGSMIPKNWILTGVRLGEWDTKSPIDCFGPSDDRECAAPPVDIPIEESIAHEQYDPSSSHQQNDIGILRLSRPVNFTEWIQPICLPHLNRMVAEKNFIGEDLYVAGWGKTETKFESDVMLKVRVPVVSNDLCSSRYSEMVGTQICAGGRRGQDSCRGDSGGPLMAYETFNRKTNWYAIGLVSFGPTPCGMEGWPGVYTSIAPYSNWLISKMRS